MKYLVSGLIVALYSFMMCVYVCVCVFHVVCVMQSGRNVSAKTNGLSIVEARRLQQRELEQNLKQSLAALWYYTSYTLNLSNL